LGGSKKEDIDRVRREEESRGRRRPPDEEKVRERRQLKQDWRSILASMKFSEAIGVLGLQSGSPEYQEFLMIWREYQQSRLKRKRQLRRQQP